MKKKLYNGAVLHHPKDGDFGWVNTKRSPSYMISTTDSTAKLTDWGTYYTTTSIDLTNGTWT